MDERVLRTALVLGGVAIVVAFVLKFMGKDERSVLVNGSVEPGFEDVQAAFRAYFESEDVEPREGGSAFSAYYKGKQVVNLWGGYADFESSQPWREDTMGIVFSTTKGMAALCMAILVDRGHLDYNKKVSHYWPEFAQNGKEDVTVKMLLNHEAGLAVVKDPLTIDLLKNYEELGSMLASSPPMWEPGTTHGYHGLTFGFIVSQLLTRADPQKRTLGVFFRDEVARPFGIDFHIGLPRELNYRVARYFTGQKPLRNFIKSLRCPINRELYWGWLVTGECKIKEIAENGAAILDFYMFNDPENRAIEWPSATGIGTAESLAKVYGIIANGGKSADGKQLLSAKMIKFLHEERTERFKDAILGIPSQFSQGFFRVIYQDRVMLGHPGAGGNDAYADIERHIGVGFVTRYGSAFGLGNDPRFMAVRDAVYECIDKVEKLK